MNSKLLALVTLALAGGAPSAARANEPQVVSVAPVTPSPTRFSLGVDVHNEWRLDSSYRLLSRERSDTAAGLSASADLVRRGSATLAAAVGWHADTATTRWSGGANIANTGSTEVKLGQDTVTVSALLRWSLRPWLEPHVRLAADATWAKLTLASGDGTSLDGKSWSPGGSAGAGFRLRTRTLGTALRGGALGIALALMVEGGFHLGAPLSFDLARTRPAYDNVAGDQLPSGTTPIGSFGRSQPYLRVSFQSLF